MIVVKVERNRRGISGITIEGHANAAEHGKDIVCSAVSAISFGLLNAVYPLVGIIPDVEQNAESGGFIRWQLHVPDDVSVHEKQQLLAESMVIALYAVSQQYGAYVSVIDPKE